ncbi:endonuclease/exonuclease/phosphatase family protein [Candidatus Woesearchaeota archaeon]|nr:MAG: endonuclease/exonuclease/phosphatase family protein [Candidatus Woesearchaeota archaeon]
MPLKLVSLNVERGRHLDRFIPFLEKEQADVVCLYEVCKVDLPRIAASLGAAHYFVPMCTVSPGNPFMPDGKGVQGLAVFTTVPAESEHAFYVGTGEAREFLAPNSEDRPLVVTTARKDGEAFVIGATHFTWTADGEANEEQRAAFAKLMTLIQRYPPMVLCGDFNAPRGKEIFTKFTEYFTDNLPRDVTSTLDERHHRKPGLKLAVDTIFSVEPYTVSDVRVVEGVSDHKAIVGRIHLMKRRTRA